MTKKIKSLKGPTELQERLRELGLRPGVLIQIHGQTSFQGATLIQVGNAWLALRESEFQCLIL